MVNANFNFSFSEDEFFLFSHQLPPAPHKSNNKTEVCLTDVQRFNCSELVRVLFHQISELVEEPSALASGNFDAPYGLVGFLGCVDGNIDVLFGTNCDGDDNFTSRCVVPSSAL
jgi:hypothetical protein